MWHMHTMDYFSVMRKKEILSFATVWMRRHYAKSDTERQILYDITYMQNLKRAKHIKTEWSGGYQCLGSRGSEEMYIKGTEL